MKSQIGDGPAISRDKATRHHGTFQCLSMTNASPKHHECWWEKQGHWYMSSHPSASSLPNISPPSRKDPSELLT